jgi:hypothetical protein
MFSFGTLSSLAMQLARLVPSPSARLQGKAKPASGRLDGGCGACPLCHEFVWVEFPAPDQEAPCPRCGQPILFLEALGPS